MKFFKSTFILSACLLFFAAMSPAYGGQATVPDSAALTTSVEQGVDVPASAFSSTIMKFEKGTQFVAGITSPDYILPAIYESSFIVQKQSGIASARYDKAKARAPDIGGILAALFTGKDKSVDNCGSCHGYIQRSRERPVSI